MSSGKNFHFGEILEDYLIEHRVSNHVFAMRMGVSDSAAFQNKKNRYAHLSTIWGISRVFRHNFFTDLAECLPDDYTQNRELTREKDEEIARLKEENKLLKAQLEVLKR